MHFFIEAHDDGKGVKQIMRLILSKFVRRQSSRSDNDWATMWRDMLCLREKAFPFLDLEYMLIEFCRGLLKAGKFLLARNYLKGTSSVSLAAEKAENLVIQAAREYFFSASSLNGPEVSFHDFTESVIMYSLDFLIWSSEFPFVSNFSKCWIIM